MKRQPMPRFELLADPQNPRDPADLGHVEHARGMTRVEGAQFHFLRRLAQELLGHDLALAGSDHDAVAAADAGRGRDDDLVAVAIDRRHAVAADLQGIGRGIAQIGKVDLLPAAAHGISRVVEKSGGTRLGIADHRQAAHEAGGPTAQQSDEIGHGLVGGGEDFGNALGRGPARLALAGHALALVEGGGVELGAARQT